MKENFLLSLLLILPALCFSQADFRNGFIVTNATDTVRGLVLYDKTSKAYHTVEFRQSSTQNTTTYTAEQIVGYGFEGSTVYESRNIELEDGSHATKFLQVFVRGAVSLYHYAGEWWIEKEQQGGLIELVNKQREVIVNGQRVQRNSNQHLSTLNTMMFDCIELRPALKSVALTEHTLVQLVTDYNRCKGSDAKVFNENKSWRAYKLGIIGGLNISTLTLTSNKEGWAHTVGKFDPSSSTAFGVSLSFRTSKTNRNYSFTGALLYVATESLNYNVIEHISYETRNWVNVSIQQLKIPVGLR